MKRSIKGYDWLYLLLVFLVSCSSLSSQYRCLNKDNNDVMMAIQKLENFRSKDIPLDYIASCKARIITSDKSFSGSCELILTRNQELQLTILNPLGGTVLQVYADQQIIQVNDFSDKHYYEWSSGDPRSLELPIIRDLSLVELQSIIWGRLTPEAENTLAYELENKKPVRIFKKNQTTDLDVTYLRWLDYQEHSFPRLFTISNRRNGSSVKIAVTRFQPGYVCNLKLKDRFK